MKRKRFTYIPKDEIAEITTFNDVTFENDAILDGAYVKGRKKFARGGYTGDSLEKQALQAVGIDSWFNMEESDRQGLVQELASSGVISEGFARGGKISPKKIKLYYHETSGGAEYLTSSKVKGSKNEGTFDSEYVVRIDSANTHGGELNLKDEKEKIKLYHHETSGGAEYLTSSKVKGSKNEGSFDSEYVVRIDSAKTNGGELMIKNSEGFAYGGMMAKGGMTIGIDKSNVIPQYFVYDTKTGKRKYFGSKQEALSYKAQAELDASQKDSEESWSEFMKYWNDDDKMVDGGMMKSRYIVTFAHTDDDGEYVVQKSKPITAKNEDDAAIILKDQFESFEGINCDIISVEKFADGGMMADGGVATAATYMVKYHMKDAPKEIKEKLFTDKDKAELFYETLQEEDDIVVMPIVEVKPEVKAESKPKSLFATAKPAPATAAAKKKRDRVQVDGIADDIKRYDELKAVINNAEAEKEIIGGKLKEIGRDKFLDIYEDTGRRPANFDLADGNENILLEVTDKYLKVEPEKAAILEKYDGLLEVVTTYEFNKDVLEKKVSDDMTVGDVVSMLIQDSKLLSDSDKENLIKAKTAMRVPKGTLDRLMDYDNPREVFNLIAPVLALK